MTIIRATLNKLYTLSRNVCAFPDCTNPILDTEHSVLTGQVCHIKGRSPSGPRYDASQTPEERDGFDNLILMCGAHNKIVDDPLTQAAFTVKILTGYKRDHEARSKNTVVKENVLERFAEMILALQAQTPPRASIVPVVESLMTRADNQMRVDYYDFRVRLRNDGDKTARSFRLEVEVPNAYANPTHSSMAEVRQHTRGDVTLYRHTQEHFRNFILYPGETSDYVLLIDYQLRHDQYKDVDSDIRVVVYSDDNLLNKTHYSIAAFRNKDRMDLLGLTEGVET
jgi:hypothetical protein